jgi:hypothetical protein
VSTVKIKNIHVSGECWGLLCTGINIDDVQEGLR